MAHYDDDLGNLHSIFIEFVFSKLDRLLYFGSGIKNKTL